MTRRQRFSTFTARHGVVVGVVLVAVQFGAAYAYGIKAETDFSIFQRTTERFVRGLPMYSPDFVDFTPPLFHAFLLPLVHVPPPLAFALWTVIGVAVATLVFLSVIRTVPGAWQRRWIIGAWIVNLAGVQMTVRLGQVSWLVAFLLTRAWISARDGRWTSTGVWGGLAIALKPFLLVILPVMAIRQQWKAMAVSVLTTAMCSLLGILCFGRPAFADWLHNLQLVPDPVYATHFLNASWAGFIARAAAPYWIGNAASAATIALVLLRVKTWDEDRTWFIVGVSALLASPVGWIYYYPMLLGPAVALAVDGRISHLGWLGFTSFFPPLSGSLFQGEAKIIAMTFGSVYFWGLLVAFVSTVVPGRRVLEARANEGNRTNSGGVPARTRRDATDMSCAQ